MVDIIVFSKDRPLQLYNNLESIQKFVSGYDSIHVMFNYSNDEYKASYEKLNLLDKFDDVVFVDEKVYGFNTTIRTLLQQLTNDYLLMEIDDEVYCDYIDLKHKCLPAFKNDLGRVNFAADYKIYDPKYYKAEGDYLLIERQSLPRTNEELCLWYSFNVSSTIHKRQDVIDLFKVEDIRNPFDLEFKGNASPIFTRYKYNAIVNHDGPIVRQLHINNFLNRYEEYYSLEDLHTMFINGFVFDLDYKKIKASKQNVEWLSNKAMDNRFPIFPWDIDPNDYNNILEKYKSIK